MKDKNATCTYSSSLDDICEANSTFDKATLRIAYYGKNSNRSDISKEAFEKAIPSAYYCPLVCNYTRATDSLGGHDQKLVRNENDVKLVNLTQPIGFVPREAEFRWEVVEEIDGTKREYLTTDVILWRRQEAYEKIKEDGITKQSMEIRIKDGEWEDGVYRVDDFEFKAFVLIGRNPCFESASLHFANEDFKTQVDEMMSEFVRQYEVDKPCDEQGQTEKGKEMKNENTSTEIVSQTGTANFELNSNVSKLLCEALQNNVGNPYKGTFYLYDYDHDIGKLYANNSSDWNLYSFAYTIENDKASIDWASERRVKISIVECDANEPTPTYNFARESVEKIDSLEKRIREYADELEKSNNEVNNLNATIGTLSNFKAEVEAKRAAEEFEAVMAQFADLAGCEEYEALRDSRDEIDCETLREKCFAIRGKNMKLTFAQVRDSGKPIIPVIHDSTFSQNEADKPYGKLFVKYRA